MPKRTIKQRVRDLFGEEPTKMITVRLPGAFHELLLQHSRRRVLQDGRVESLNDLCLEALLREVTEDNDEPTNLDQQAKL